MSDESTANPNAPIFSAGLRYMAVSAFFFSLMGLLVKLLGQRLPSQEIVFARSLLVLIFAWMMLRRAGASPWGNDKKWLFMRGFLGFVALSCFYYGLTHLPLADATLIMYTNPVFTGIFAAIFLKESIARSDVAGVLLSLVGVALIARPSFLFGGPERLDPLAVGVALAGSIVSATAYTIVRKLRRTEDPMTIVFYFPLISTPAAIPLALPDALVPQGWEWAMLLALGLITFIAQVTMTRGLSMEKAGRATSVSYLQVVFAFIWGMVFFREFPTPLSIVGAFLILLSTVGVAWWRRRRAASAAP
jgi:drug/metabolite transporter (DMT)-like permease